MSESESQNRRSRPLGRWNNKVEAYMSEKGTSRKGGFEQAKTECRIGRGGGSSAVGIPLGEVPGGSKVSETVDRWIYRLEL